MIKENNNLMSKLIQVFYYNKKIILLIIAGVLNLCCTGSNYPDTVTKKKPVSGYYAEFKPAVIDFTKDEIINPGRGFYRWNSQEIAPVSCIDRYQRYNWSVLESTDGNYDFSLIETQAALAKASGGRFGFGVRCVVQGTELAYPAYLNDLMDDWYSTNKTCRVPDWNDEDFLLKTEALITALGAQYNNDPRIGFIEIRTYGNWGEWHLSGFESPPEPLTAITQSTIQRIIDAWVSAFPDKQIIMMSDNAAGLNYAMGKTGLKYPIGWRRDSWCNAHFNSIVTGGAWSSAMDRWKTAPVIVESYNSSGVTTSLGPDQIINYHISLVGNGNFGVWNTLNSDQQSDLITSAKYSGYRFVLRKLKCPRILKSGTAQEFTVVWSNTGVSGVYYNWDIYYILKNRSDGTIVWQGKSSLDLKTLLPTYVHESSTDNPVTVKDLLTPDQNIPPGTYELGLIITDPSGYYSSPLNLAIEGRTSDGSYNLGTVSVE